MAIDIYSYALGLSAGQRQGGDPNSMTTIYSSLADPLCDLTVEEADAMIEALPEGSASITGRVFVNNKTIPVGGFYDNNMLLLTGAMMSGTNLDAAFIVMAGKAVQEAVFTLNGQTEPYRGDLAAIGTELNVGCHPMT